MAAIHHNARIERLLQDLNASLLQYLGDCSSWDADPEVETRIQQLVQRQQDSVTALADLLTLRRWPTRLASYPTEYTDLHFLSAKYLLPKVVANQQAVLAELDEASHTMAIDDLAAATLLKEIIASERETLMSLQGLLATPSSAA